MLAAQSPLMSGHDHQLIKRPKSSRKALQPKNPPASSTPISYNSKQKCIEREMPVDQDSNKENVPPIYSTTTTTSPVPVKKEEESFHEIEGSFDASLAEELSAIREKLERLRIDKEKTENMLGERGLMLDLTMKYILHRGELQKQHEIEVDRLFRLNEIRLTCLQRISPLRSLRDKEQEKKLKQDQLKSNVKTEDRDEGKDENPSQSQHSQVNAEN